MEFNHYTVMKNEAVDMLQITEERQNKIYVDATLGGGGHSELILKKLRVENYLNIRQKEVQVRIVTQDWIKKL